MFSFLKTQKKERLPKSKREREREREKERWKGSGVHERREIILSSPTFSLKRTHTHSWNEIDMKEGRKEQKDRTVYGNIWFRIVSMSGFVRKEKSRRERESEREREIEGERRKQSWRDKSFYWMWCY